jgi:hypothetical protein
MLQPVRLMGVPVTTFLESAQHADDVVRELWLISLNHRGGRQDHYRRLSHAADRSLSTGAELRHATLAQVTRARAEGRQTVDLQLVVPPSMAQATLDWDALLDELDALCRAEVLLNLPCNDEVQAFRRWYVGETVRQLQHGQRPTPYTRWRKHGWSAARPQPTGA